MVNHTSTFFKPLTESLKGNCEFGIYQGNKNTYITYRAENDTEVAVIITTKFNPQNTVRIQFVSEECTKKDPKRLISNNEIKLIEESLGIKFDKPEPADTAKNADDYTYYRIMFPFTNEPVEVLNKVSETLVKIFNICK